MLSHNYNTRLNYLTSNEENILTEVSASNDTTVDAPSQTNSLEQYGHWYNIEIAGIPDNVPNQNLEEKVVDILN